jgi:hypothetical protein
MTLEFLDFGITTERLLLVIYFDSEYTLFDHFRIHSNKLINNSTSSCPLESIRIQLWEVFRCMHAAHFSNSLILRARALTSFGLNYFLAKMKEV